MENTARKKLMNQLFDLERKLAKLDDSESRQLYNIVAKEITELSQLSESAFKEVYRKYYASAVTAILILLFSIAGFSQVNLKQNPVPDDVVKVFINARCDCSATDTATVASFPAMYRSFFVNSIYNDGEYIPFQVYYAENIQSQLYLISKGACRNLNTTIPLPAPGFYFVRFYHAAKPALIEIDARQTELKIRAFGKCELHEFSSPKGTSPFKSN